MLMWRVGNNHLPMKTNLLRQGIVHDAQFPICGRDEETVKHFLWSCPSAQDV